LPPTSGGTGGSHNGGGRGPNHFDGPSGGGGSGSNGNGWLSLTAAPEAAPTINDAGEQASHEGDTVSLPITARDSDGDPLKFAAVGLPQGLSINPNSGVISGTVSYQAAESFGGFNGESRYDVTIIAADGHGGNGSMTFTWYVDDTFRPPVFDNPGSQSSAKGQLVSLPISATAPDGGQINYGATGLPPGLSIDPITGEISGVPAANASTDTPYTVTVGALAQNGVSYLSSTTFDWSVTPALDPTPQVQGIPDQTTLAGTDVWLTMTAADPNNAPLTWSANGLPPGLSIDPATGLITGSITASADTQPFYEVIVTASNGTASDVQAFGWNVSFLYFYGSATESNREGDNVQGYFVAGDAFNLPVTYSATGLPPGLSIDPETGLVSGTVAAGSWSLDPYVVTVSAGDGVQQASLSVNWTIDHAVDVPPVFNNLQDQTNHTGDNVDYFVPASSPTGDYLTYSATGLPDGLQIDQYTGEISGTIADDARSTSAQVSVNDGEGGQSYANFNWNITTPQMTLLSNTVTATEGQDVAGNVLASLTSDYPAWQAVNYSTEINWGDATLSEVLPDGADGQFTISGSHVYHGAGTYSVLITVADTAGDTASTTATVQVSPAAIQAQGGFYQEVGWEYYWQTVQGQPMWMPGPDQTPLVLATFQVADTAPTDPHAYTATVDWGNGLVLPADAVKGDFGSYVVEAACQTGMDCTPIITITDAYGDSATVTSTVHVVSAYAGVPAQLSVYGPYLPYAWNTTWTSVQVAWGDGSTSTGYWAQGEDPYSDGWSAAFYHTYQATGQYTISAIVNSNNGGYTVNGPAEIGDAPITSYGKGWNDFGGARIATEPGDTNINSAQVAVFSDPNPLNAASDYGASVQWGDGQPDSAGVISGSAGLFEVTGSHTSPGAGLFATSTTIRRANRAQQPAGAAPGGAQANPQNVIIAGTIQYDQATGAAKPVRHALVHVVAMPLDNGLAEGGTAYTDDNGHYSIPLPGTGYASVKATVYPISDDIGQYATKRSVAFGSDGLVFYKAENIAGPQNVPNYVIGNGTADDKKFWVFDALVTAAKFNALLVPYVHSGTIDAAWAPGGSTGSFTTPLTEAVNVGSTDWNDWNTIVHEYGHALALENGFFPTTPLGPFTTPGYLRTVIWSLLNVQNLNDPSPTAFRNLPPLDPPMYHRVELNNRQLYDRQSFRTLQQLAFSEGFADFFSVLAQTVAGVPNPTTSLAVSNPNNPSFYTYSVESAQPLQQAVPAGAAPISYSGGEDEELTVMRVLWDLYDNTNTGDSESAIGDTRILDNYHMGYSGLFRLIKENHVTTLADLWANLVYRAMSWNENNYYLSVANDFGGIFELNNVSPHSLQVFINNQFQAQPQWSAKDANGQPSAPPTFYWDAPAGWPGDPTNPNLPGALGQTMTNFAFIAFDNSGAPVGQSIMLPAGTATLVQIPAAAGLPIQYQYHWTPSAQQWQQFAAVKGNMNWVIAGAQSVIPETNDDGTPRTNPDGSTLWKSSPVLNMYWSAPRSININT